MVRCVRDFITNVELTLVTPILPLAAVYSHTCSDAVRTVIRLLAVLQCGLYAVSAIVFYSTSNYQSLAAILALSAAGVGATMGWVAGRDTGFVGFVLSRVSVVHFITLLPFWHASTAEVPRIAFSMAVIYLIHATFSLWYLFIAPVVDTFHAAWGCYPTSSKLADYKYGMCGSRMQWNHDGPSEICERLALTGQGVHDCGALPTHNAWSLHGQHIMAVAQHMIAVAAVLYVSSCKAQFIHQQQSGTSQARAASKAGGKTPTEPFNEFALL